MPLVPGREMSVEMANTTLGAAVIAEYLAMLGVCRMKGTRDRTRHRSFFENPSNLVRRHQSPPTRHVSSGTAVTSPLPARRTLYRLLSPVIELPHHCLEFFKPRVILEVAFHLVLLATKEDGPPSPCTDESIAEADNGSKCAQGRIPCHDGCHAR